MEKLHITSNIAPVIVRTLNGYFAVSGNQWFPVTAETELSNIEWENTSSIPPKTIDPDIHLVKSSDGKTDYAVKIQDGIPTCTCMGFSFHRHCRHIDKIYGKQE